LPLTTSEQQDPLHILRGAATNDQNLTVPVGGTLVLGLNANDNAVLRGPIAAINLNFDGANDAATNSLNAAGLVLIDDPGNNDEDVLLSALSVGSASIVVSADGASTLGVSTRANTINITIVASCVTATVSDADTVVDAGSRNATPAVACQTAAQVARGTDVTTYAAGEAACITAVVKNAYGVVVPSDTFAVTATNGALVNMDGSTISLTSPDVKGSTSFDTATADGTDVFVRVDAPSGAAMSTVVTISYAGQVVATKTLTWRGEATKINVLASSIGKTSGQGQIHYTLTDAAGNLTAGNVTGLVTSFGAQVTSTTDSANTANYTVTEPLWATA